MGKRLELFPYLTTDELSRRYRSYTESVERSHWQMFWLLASGHINFVNAVSTSPPVPPKP